VPAVPIAIRGSYAAMPRGRNWPGPGRPRITVRYGRPLWPAEGEGARAFGSRMTKAVGQLAAEEELGWYRALRASADGAIDLPGSRNGEVAQWRRIWESTRRPSADRRRVWR
jgi:hypothetical protein